MKRIFLVLCLSAFALAGLVVFSGCGHSHEFSQVNIIKSASCLKTGEEVLTCSICGLEKTEIIPALGHDYTDWQIVEEATCMKEGKETRSCKRCDEGEAERAIPLAQHTFSDWVIVEEAECEKSGLKERTCNFHEHKESVEIPALEHEFSDLVQTKAPTCTESGEGEATCNLCGVKKTAPLGDPLGHDFKTWIQTAEPTCVNEGEAQSACTRCGSEGTRSIEPLGHEFATWIQTAEPTCTHGGEEQSACTRCGINTIRFFGEPLGHDLGEWQEAIPATCLKEGEERAYCSRCEGYETKPIPRLEHTFSAGEKEYDFEATCLHTGRYHYECTICGGLGEDQFEPVKEHVYQKGVCIHCGRRDWKTAEITDPDLYSSDFAFKSFENKAGMQELYLAIDKAAKEYHDGSKNTEILGEFPFEGITEKEAVSVWKAYLDDHPLYYWLGRTMNYPTQNKMTVPVDLAYTNPDVRHKINEEIYSLADEWRRKAPENAYLASLAYHDFIIERVDYINQYVIYPDNANWAHNIVGVFEGKGAVCEGYARSFQLLLNMTGIQNIFVTGTSQGGNHAWNLVQLDDGGWYWYDLTYDDAPIWMWGIKYNYFALSEHENVVWVDADLIPNEPWPREFSEDHTPDHGTEEHYLGTLPARAEKPYEGFGEVKLRETFKEGKFEYAVTGFQTVQLIHAEIDGTGVAVPSEVEHEDVKYTVISVGSIKDGLLGRKIQVFGDNLQDKVGKVTIPSTVKYIWPETFCGKISSYEVSKDNEYFTTQDGALYTKHMYTLITIPNDSGKESFTVPDCVKVLATELFKSENKFLKELKIGKGVELWGTFNRGEGWFDEKPTNRLVYIENGFWGGLWNFYNLEKVEVDAENRECKVEKDGILSYDGRYYYACLPNAVEVHIPSSVESIENCAFYCRTDLKRIIFEGNNIQKFADNAFGNNWSLEDEGEIIYPGTRDEWNAIDKGDESSTNSETFKKVKVTCQG